MKNKNHSSRRVFIKQFATSTAGVALGGNIFANRNESFGLLTSSCKKQEYVCNNTILIPVKVQVKPGSILLTAGGQTIHFTGKLIHLDADQELDSTWTITEREFTIFSHKITANSTSLLKRVYWFSGEWEAGVEQVVQSTQLMDNVLFLRKEDVSFFISLDFPYSHIDVNGISYPPHERLTPGQEFPAHSLSIGACRLSGQKVGKFDRNEIEAVSSYIERRFPLRFERPVYMGCCITNRMTDVREGRIFYSMYDNPTLTFYPELIDEDLDLCAKTGIEYYQVFEDMFNWPDKEQTGASMRRLKEKASRVNVRVGDYVVPQGLYCPHYNYEHRSVNRPEWLIKDKNGNVSGPECLACTEYEKILHDGVIAHNREFELELVNFDFVDIKPCYATNHNHEPGDVYKQIYALVQLFKELAAISPDFLVWSNSGNWIELMPKLTWYNPNVYLSDPHARVYSSHLNTLKILGDWRREQMVSVHESHFVPYRAYNNCEYYFAPRSRISDTKIFEYSLLQGLTVTPNITLAEFRPFLNRVPGKFAEQSVAFIHKWLQFIRDHFEVWKQTIRVGDAPGVGAAEIYAHINKDNGFICLVNQNPFPRTATFVLDCSIGLNEGKTFSLNEVYPQECLIAEQPLPFARRDDSITCIMPAHSVRIIQVKPEPEELELPAVFGMPSSFKHLNEGYQFILSAPQGKKVEIGLVLPEGQIIDSISARQTPTVPMYTFPASAQVLEQSGNLARVEVQFPREQAPRELTRWRISPGDIEIELPTPDYTGFLGALVHNAFTENYEVQLDVRTKTTTAKNSRLLSKSPSQKLSAKIQRGDHMTYKTNFILPFIETWGVQRGYGDDPIIELAFSNPNEVGEIMSHLNGVAVPVERYRNPRSPDIFSFYIELTFNVQSGQVVELVLDVQYLKSK